LTAMIVPHIDSIPRKNLRDKKFPLMIQINRPDGNKIVKRQLS
jgi:hypothetical protein